MIVAGVMSLIAAGALAVPAGAAKRTMVPCLDDPFLNSSHPEYKPKRCSFGSEPKGGQSVSTTVSKLRWRSWGRERASARGKIRLSGGPRRAKVKLSKQRGGCFDFVKVTASGGFRTSYNLQGCPR